MWSQLAKGENDEINNQNSWVGFCGVGVFAGFAQR